MRSPCSVARVPLLPLPSHSGYRPSRTGVKRLLGPGGGHLGPDVVQQSWWPQDGGQKPSSGFQSPHHQAFRSLPTCFQGHRSPSSENSPRKGIINGRLVSLCNRKRSLILPRFLYPLPVYFPGDASKPKPDPRSVP